jgi:hypothetical protein
MRSWIRGLAVVLLVTFTSYANAQGNSWKKVRYNGGTLKTEVSPKDWNNTLTVSSERITFKLKDGQTIEIDPKTVTGLSYGQEAHRRVGTMVALGILLAPLALFGLFHKTRLHYIGVEYKDANGSQSGILLQGHKDNYRAILMALRGATAAPVAVSEEDRKYIPTGVEAVTVPKSEAAPEESSVMVTSNPDGAEIHVDGEFVGNAPATLKLAPGKRKVKVTAAGHKPWEREVSVPKASELKVNAVLEQSE